MSLTITTDVFCDSCADWTEGHAGHKIDGRAARIVAKASGWERRKIDRKRFDLCKTCRLLPLEEIRENLHNMGML